MLGLFRRNLFINSILMLPYIALLRLNTFLEPMHYVPETSILKPLFLWMSPMVQSIVAVVLIFFQAVFINRLVIMNQLTRHFTLFAGVIYALLVSMFPDYSMLSEHLIANTFLLLSFTELMKVYNKRYLSVNVFNGGFYMGLTMLISPFYSLLLLIGPLALVRFTANLKNVLQFFSGVFFVWILTLGISYLLDINISEHLKLYVPNINKELFTTGQYLNVEMIFAALLMLYCLYLYNPMKLKKSVAARNKIEVVFYFLFIALMTMFLYTSKLNLLLLFIPISILVGVDFSRRKNKILVEIIYLAAVGFLVYNHFFQ